MKKLAITSSVLLVALCVSGAAVKTYAQAAAPAAGDDKAAIEALSRATTTHSTRRT